MATVGKYDLKLVTLALWGQIITGYGEDGGIEVTVPTDETEDKVSADGEHVSISYLNDPRVEVVITVMEGTKGARILDELYLAMKALPTIPLAPFMLFDPGSGDQLTAERFVFKKRPGISKGKTAGERAWTLLLPNGLKNMRHAAAVV